MRNFRLDTSDDPEEPEFEFLNSTQFVGPNVTLVPVANAVQPTRLFYSARFGNQAQSVVNGEAPWIQTLKDGDTSYDDALGNVAGALRTDQDAEVMDATPDGIKLKLADGNERHVPLYRNLPFNRYSGLTHTAKVKTGDKVKAGSLLARSNFTDDNGTLAMGLNARVGLVPDRGYSMDDAIVISDSFAKRATSQHTETLTKDLSQGDMKDGLDHFISLFPDRYPREQLEGLDEHGVVKPGTILQEGSPVLLATKPRNFNSAQGAFGRLSNVARQMRADASMTWDHQDPGKVTDVARNKDGTIKVVVESLRPTRVGDKVVFRSGQKSIVSKIVPDPQMPRTTDGHPLEVLMNPQGLPSRANSSLALEIMLGKVAAKNGKPMKLPFFNKQSESWVDFVEQQLAQAGLKDKEAIYDPAHNRMLENPVTVGSAYLLKLHHIAEKKNSSRGSGSYDSDGQPSKGGGAGGKAKRLSGLETVGLLSSGAYNVLREGSTLKGQQNDDWWRSFRAGESPKPPGRPFVFTKFRHLLNGAGLHSREIEGGKLRLGLMTDSILDQYRPLPVKNGKTINFRSLEPESGGLFDPALVSGERWGSIDLPEPMPQPAAEDVIRGLLGLTQKEFEAVLVGEKELQS